MNNYAVIVCNHEAHSFETREAAEAKANEYTSIRAQIAYWPNRDMMPIILGDNRAVRVQHALDNGLI